MQRPGVMQSPPFMQRGTHRAEEWGEQKKHSWWDSNWHLNTWHIHSLSYLCFCLLFKSPLQSDSGRGLNLLHLSLYLAISV